MHDTINTPRGTSRSKNHGSASKRDCDARESSCMNYGEGGRAGPDDRLLRVKPANRQGAIVHQHAHADRQPTDDTQSPTPDPNHHGRKTGKTERAGQQACAPRRSCGDGCLETGTRGVEATPREVERSNPMVKPCGVGEATSLGADGITCHPTVAPPRRESGLPAPHGDRLCGGRSALPSHATLRR